MQKLINQKPLKNFYFKINWTRPLLWISLHFAMY